MNTYIPQPLDTKHIKLPASLEPLIERLAENTHESWSAQRIKDGWTHGLQRDDAGKKHPCLVPYNQLPESEKEYDRHTAVAVIKAVMALGYRIEEPV